MLLVSFWGGFIIKVLAYYCHIYPIHRRREKGRKEERKTGHVQTHTHTRLHRKKIGKINKDQQQSYRIWNIENCRVQGKKRFSQIYSRIITIVSQPESHFSWCLCMDLCVCVRASASAWLWVCMYVSEITIFKLKGLYNIGWACVCVHVYSVPRLHFFRWSEQFFSYPPKKPFNCRKCASFRTVITLTRLEQW